MQANQSANDVRQILDDIRGRAQNDPALANEILINPTKVLRDNGITQDNIDQITAETKKKLNLPGGVDACLVCTNCNGISLMSLG